MTPAHELPREGAQLFDRYLLVAEQRDRGLGEAWRARDTLANNAERLVKLHPLPTDAGHDPNALVARLRGTSAPGLAAVLAGGVWQGRLCLVHDACAGRSLRHWLDGWQSTQTSPTPGTAKMLFLHLCSVIHDAHGKNFAHERLNPSSIVITSVKAPKPLVLLDAGVAAFLPGDDQAACLNYLSPDQFDRPRRGAVVDPTRADLFALGVILAEILTLRPTPRAGTRETWEQLARANPKKSLASLVARPDDVHPDLWGLVERLILQRTDPELASASKIRQAARKAWDAAGARDETPESLREAPQPAEQAPRASYAPQGPAPRAERRESSPSWEPPPAVVQASRAAVVQVYSVEARGVAEGVSGDTLIDHGDGAPGALAVAQAVRALSRSSPEVAVNPRGGATLMLGDVALGAGQLHVVDGSHTLLVDPRSASELDDQGPPTTPLVQHVSSSDPFASFGKRDSGTLSLEDARASLAPDGAAIRPSGPPNATIAMSARNVPSNTLPVEGVAAPFAQIVPRPSSMSQPPYAPVPMGAQPQVAGAWQSAQHGAVSPPASSPWGMKFALAVLAAGVLIGVLIVVVLRAG